MSWACASTHAADTDAALKNQRAHLLGKAGKEGAHRVGGGAQLGLVVGNQLQTEATHRIALSQRQSP